MRGGDVVVADVGDQGEGGRMRRISDVGGVRWILFSCRRIGERVVKFVVVIGGFVNRLGEGGVGSIGDGFAVLVWSGDVREVGVGGWDDLLCMLMSTSRQYSSP